MPVMSWRFSLSGHAKQEAGGKLSLKNWVSSTCDPNR